MAEKLTIWTLIGYPLAREDLCAICVCDGPQKKQALLMMCALSCSRIARPTISTASRWTGSVSNGWQCHNL